MAEKKFKNYILEPQLPAEAFVDPLNSLSKTVRTRNRDVVRLRDVLSATNGVFGGDGSDGYLRTHTGTTTLDFNSANILIKNYTHVKISGDSSIGFSNPASDGSIAYFKVQGDVIIDSSATRAIDLRLMGAAGGVGVSGTDGTNGTNAFQILDASVHYGALGQSATNQTSTGGLVYADSYLYGISTDSDQRKTVAITPGSGGGGGGAGVADGQSDGIGGDGGRGGGAIFIECAGRLIFTGTIDVSGEAGSAGALGAGGGGGTAGMVLILANSITTNTGTVTDSGGAGGAGDTGFPSAYGGGNPGSGGAGSGSYSAAGGDGRGGQTATTGTNGDAAGGASAGGGGGGQGGYNSGALAGGTGGAGGASGSNSLITQNNILA